MRVIDVGQEAYGVIAIGQIATGVIAVGQVATGVIAIGQVARGVVAVGMAALGVWTWGLAAAGALRAAGLVGLAPTAGVGLILPLVPSIGAVRILPQTTTLDQLYATRRWAGWIEVELRVAGDQLTFLHAGQPIAMRVDAIGHAELGRYARGRPYRTLAFVSVAGSELVCTRLMDSGQHRHTQLMTWVKIAIQLALLVAVMIAVWWVALAPLGDALLGPGGVLVTR